MTTPPAGVALAAGSGTRLRPLTTVRPKALCPINNVPLLDRALDRLRPHTGDGPHALAVNAHHLAKQITDHVGDRAHTVVERPVALGTAGALGGLHAWLDGRDVLVTNADAYLPSGLDMLLAGWDGQRCRLLVVPAVGGRGDFTAAGGPVRYVGACLLPWRLVRRLAPVPSGLYEVLWRIEAAAGRLDLVHTAGVAIDCGTPADYLRANLHGSGGRSVVGGGAVVEGRIERCVVWDGAYVGPDERLVNCIRAGTRDTPLTVPVPLTAPAPHGTIAGVHVRREAGHHWGMDGQSVGRSSATRRVVRRSECNVITAEMFNAPGLEAIEPIGPDAPVRHTGAVFMLHDSVIAAGKGIGHHPHRGYERLFYLLSGGLHHDDALNNITADASAGDLAIFTEGRRGMIHAESNPAAEDARIWIIVAPTDPLPPTASVRVLDGDDAGRARPADGVDVKEIVGGASPAEVFSDVRWLADVHLAAGAVFTRPLADGEAVVVQPVAGHVRAMSEHLDTDDLLAVGPHDTDRTVVVASDDTPARVLIAVTGPGDGFALNAA